MKGYFGLQFKLLNRTLTELGSRPVFAYPLGIIVFIGLSLLLFVKTEFAEYIYIISALSLALKLSEVKRNEFLKSIFSNFNYFKIRILENLIVIFPFVVFLLYNMLFFSSGLLVFVAVFFVLVKINKISNIVIPTPFGKIPFEFPVGFRKTFYFFPLAYYLTFQSILADNFNLGLASIVLIGLVVMSYYSNLENEYYIWSFNTSPKDFLLLKVKTGLWLFTLLVLPIIIALALSFFDNFSTLLFCITICYVYIITIILAKYSAYPSKMNLTEGVFIGMSLMFMPLLIGIIPFLYYKSIQQLKPILEYDED